MSARADAATLLERALANHAAASGVALTVDTITSTRWASATFVGARHTIPIRVTGPGARAWLAGLPEADLPIRRHLVADAIVRDTATGPDGTVATIEVLTVEDGA